MTNLSLKARLWLLGVVASSGVAVLAVSSIVFTSKSESILHSFVNNPIAARQIATMSYASGLQKQALFSIALVLFCFIMLINSLLNFFLKKGEKP